MLFQNLIEVVITGEKTERFFNLCSHHGIILYDIILSEENCRFKLQAKDFFNLKPLVKKSGIKIKIIQKQGPIFWFKKQTKRKLFFTAPFLGLLLLWIASHFLWNIQIDGNYSITNDILKDFLKSQGVYYGMPLSEIPIAKLKTSLRNQYEEVTWVSIYLKGTSLQILLKENDGEIIKKEEPQNYGENLVASFDGIVESVLIRQGTLMVKKGDSVKKGDVLISGKVEIPAEDGSLQEVRYCRADGDICLTCEYPVYESLNKTYQEKVYTGREKKKIMVCTNKKNYLLPFAGIPYSSYDTLTEDIENRFTDFFSSLLKIKKITVRDYHIYEKMYTTKEVSDILNKKLYKIIETLQEKGVQIIEKNVKINTTGARGYLTGTLKIKYKCNEYKIMEELHDGT